MATIDYMDLELAMDFVSAGVGVDAAAYISRSTGEIYLDSPELDGEPPPGIENVEMYAEVPTKHDLDLGKALVLRFMAERIPESYRAVEEIFRRRGAYGRYKSFLESRGCLEVWHEYEESAIKAALIEWAESENFSVKC